MAAVGFEDGEAYVVRFKGRIVRIDSSRSERSFARLRGSGERRAANAERRERGSEAFQHPGKRASTSQTRLVVGSEPSRAFSSTLDPSHLPPPHAFARSPSSAAHLVSSGWIAPSVLAACPAHQDPQKHQPVPPLPLKQSCTAPPRLARRAFSLLRLPALLAS